MLLPGYDKTPPASWLSTFVGYPSASGETDVLSRHRPGLIQVWSRVQEDGPSIVAGRGAVGSPAGRQRERRPLSAATNGSRHRAATSFSRLAALGMARPIITRRIGASVGFRTLF
jgi:hypothetical protein